MMHLDIHLGYNVQILHIQCAMFVLSVRFLFKTCLCLCYAVFYM